MEKRQKKMRSLHRALKCEFSGKVINKNDHVVLVENAILYLRKLGYLVSNFKFLFLILFFTIFIPFSVNSAVMDSYNELDSSYVLLDNSDNFLAELTLLTPHINNVIDLGPNIYQLVAEIEINSVKDLYNLFTSMEFYDLKSQSIIERDFKFMYKSIDGYREIPVYNYSDCDLSNAAVPKCKKTIDYIIYEPIIQWYDFDINNKITDRDLTIGLFTDVKSGDYVDFIPTFLDIKMDNWAIWNETLNSTIYSFYEFNSSTGSVLIDSVQQQKNGSIGNGENSDWKTGLIGNAYHFDGGTEWVSFSDSYSVFDGVSADYTINLFFKNITCQGGAVVLATYNDDQAAQPGNDIYISSGCDTLTFTVGDASNYISIANIDWITNDNKYHMATLVKGNGQMWVYIDGQLNETKAASGNTFGAGNDFRLADDLNVNFYIGELENIAIFTTNLSSNDVAGLCNYNGSDCAGLPYSSSFPFVNTEPIVSLESPSNNSNFNYSNINFQCNGSDGTDNLINLSLYLSNTSIYTVYNLSHLQSSLNISYNYSLPNGLNNWTCVICDFYDICNTTSNYFVNISYYPAVEYSAGIMSVETDDITTGIIILFFFVVSGILIYFGKNSFAAVILIFVGFALLLSSFTAFFSIMIICIGVGVAFLK